MPGIDQYLEYFLFNWRQWGEIREAYREVGSKWYSDKRWIWSFYLFIQAASNLSSVRVRFVICSTVLTSLKSSVEKASPLNLAKTYRFIFSQCFCAASSCEGLTGFICRPSGWASLRRRITYLPYHAGVLLGRRLCKVCITFSIRLQPSSHVSSLKDRILTKAAIIVILSQFPFQNTIHYVSQAIFDNDDDFTDNIIECFKHHKSFFQTRAIRKRGHFP